MPESLFNQGRKTLLVVLFIPSVERDGVTAVDQQAWVDSGLEMFGRTFGGATAYPRARGIWRDDERGGTLVKDEPVMIHCYMAPAAITDPASQRELGRFCRRMGRETNQGEIGLVIGDEYFAITDFWKKINETPIEHGRDRGRPGRHPKGKGQVVRGLLRRHGAGSGSSRSFSDPARRWPGHGSDMDAAEADPTLAGDLETP